MVVMTRKTTKNPRISSIIFIITLAIVPMCSLAMAEIVNPPRLAAPVGAAVWCQWDLLRNELCQIFMGSNYCMPNNVLQQKSQTDTTAQNMGSPRFRTMACYNVLNF